MILSKSSAVQFLTPIVNCMKCLAQQKTWKKPSVPKEMQTKDALYHQIHSYILFLWEDIALGIKVNTLKVLSYKIHCFIINIPTMLF